MGDCLLAQTVSFFVLKLLKFTNFVETASSILFFFDFSCGSGGLSIERFALDLGSGAKGSNPATPTTPLTRFFFF